jgi:hypothetical protein
MPRLEWILKMLADRWDHLFRQREEADPYRVSVIVTPATYFDRSRTPFELRYALHQLPDGFDRVRELLAEGKGIAILRVPRSPHLVKQAAVRLAKTQHQTVEPWLARLIFTERIPVIDSEALYRAQQEGIDPYEDARTVLAHRVGMIRFALVDLKGRGISASDLEQVEALNRVIEPLSAAYLHHRLNEDWPEKKIRFVSVTLRVVLFAGLLSLLLPYWFVFAFVFAALADDIARLIGRFFSLRNAGYTRKQLKEEILPYVVPFAVALLWAFVSVSFYRREEALASGFFFGLAASSFPLFESARLFFKTRSVYRMLEREGKLSDHVRRSPTGYAFYELRRHKTLWGLMLGAFAAPFFCALTFFLVRDLPPDPWIFALCGVLDVIFAIVLRWMLQWSDRIKFVYTMVSRLGTWI